MAKIMTLCPLLFKYFKEYNLHKNPFSVHIEHLDPHFSITSVALCRFLDRLVCSSETGKKQEAVTLIKYGRRMNGFMWRWGSQKWVKVMRKCWHYIPHTLHHHFPQIRLGSFKRLEEWSEAGSCASWPRTRWHRCRHKFFWHQ